MKRKVMISTSSRAERGLLQPIIKRIEEQPKLKCILLQIDPQWTFSEVSDYTLDQIEEEKPDVVLVPCDRREQVPVALTCYSKNVPVCHFYSGSSVGGNIQDEVYGLIIALSSHFHLCHDEGAAEVLRRIGIEEWRIHVVGSTAFDDIKLDETIVPNEPYDLVLINPDTVSMENTKRDIRDALSRLKRFTIIVGPNEDENKEIVVEEIENFVSTGKVPCKFHPRFPREQFLALLKNCNVYFTNSSSAFFEAPHFSAKCEIIGERNRFRDVPVKIDFGASDRIVNLLENIELDEKMLRKRVCLREESLESIDKGLQKFAASS